ncbi:hypothetical protein [Myxococcus sp. RHSTA-1-4]|uniref:hypothetical protein n=1 Tax=Myxococcus sp. RHSTA-1-4 TaxID=2874601 RepID=UPI001CBE0485|nr:hypothetical protein [Myxococcus sp. RHSTA-1-4]MBZ4418698.1 hypothetical protein [Myxococcus sp. RHSTA-1-4]
MRSRSRAARGQSLVETALGLMVFVTILVFGIYFAEVGALTLKVQEAANFALWDATGRVLHDPEAGQWGRRGAVAGAEAEAAARYVDFDGRERMGGTGMPIQQAIARALPIQVRCDAELPAGVPGLAPGAAGPALAAAMDVGTQGMACTASSRLRAMRVGRFMEGADGFFQVSHRRAAAAFTVCAAGRASGDTCPGRFGLLLDDWGLSGVEEGRACPLSIDSGAPCANRDYSLWTERIFRANGGGGGAGSALAAVVGAASVNEDQFFMSFRGEEDDYEENIGPTHAGGQSRWEVTPFNAPNSPSYAAPRSNHFLGVPR